MNGYALMLFCFFASVWLPSMCAAERIVLHADQHDGHDAAWQKRHRYGRATWGIRGSGKVEEGAIWFDAFPGESGEYRVLLHGIFEQDGSPFFAVRAGERVLAKGRFPYPKGEKDCKALGIPGKLDLGVHYINRGERVAVWAQSVYECGRQGAYTLWDKLVFIRKKDSVDKKRKPVKADVGH